MATTYDKASLVMIPSGYKDDKLYSVKPTDGSGDFTFSRDGAGASPATRVNASGLIEKGRENILPWSNNYDNWIKTLCNVTSGQSGYDGTNDAWLLTSTGSGNSLRRDVAYSGVNSFSVYAKAGTADGIRLRFDAATDRNLMVNLTNGSVISGVTTAFAYSVEDVGGGWYRVTATADLTTGINVRLIVTDDTGTQSTGSVYIQDAQLEQGLISTSYIETTTAPVSAGLLGDMPRLDYSGGATCPSLLLEGSRVNSLTHSEYLEGYGKLSSGTGSAPVLTTNYTTSIEGVQNATRIQFDRGAGGTSTDYSLLDFSGISLTGDITMSFYAKTLSGTSANLLLYTGGFDTNDGDVLALTDEWQRFTISGTNTSGTISFLIGTRGGSTYFYQGGDQTLDVAVYGFQCEAGSYPTSYIPTYGSASLRADDVCNAPYNAIADKTEATLMVEYSQPIAQPSGLNHIAGYRDNANGDFYILQIGSSNNHELRWRGQNGTAISLSIAIDEATYGLHRKVAFVKTNDKLIGYCNGVKIGETSSGSTNAFSTNTSEELDLWYSGFVERNDIKQLVVIPSALTDAEAIALTTI